MFRNHSLFAIFQYEDRTPYDCKFSSFFLQTLDSQIKFKSDDDVNHVIKQIEQLILQTTLGGNSSTNSGIGDRIGDPGFCGPQKNCRLQSPPRQINDPYDELLHLDYKLHEHVTRVAESLDGLASPTGNPEEKAIKTLESGIKNVGMGLKHIRAIPCRTNDETMIQREILERYEGVLIGMKQAEKTIRNRKPPQTEACVFNNRK